MQDTSKMTPKELYNYRIKLYRDSQNFKKVERIPLCGNMFTWMFLDAGYTATKAARDYNLINECMIRFIKKYKVDQVNCLNSGYRNPFLLSDALGGSTVYTDDNADNLNAICEDLMQDDEYDEITDDFLSWSWKALLRKFPRSKDMTPEEVGRAAKTVTEFNDAKYNTNVMLHEQYGSLAEIDIYNLLPSFEALACWYRGFKNTSIDLRRRKKQLERYVEVNDRAGIAAFKEWLSARPDGPNMDEPFDVCTAFLAYALVNTKQWEKLYLPLLDEEIPLCEEHGKQIVFWSEGSWDRFGSYFNQYKKGTITMMVESDNIFEMREKYPNICLMGGIDRDLLSTGTPDQCVKQVQKVIDEIGRDGGLILQPNKMISYANDCKPENLEAVCDFVISYEL